MGLRDRCLLDCIDWRYVQSFWYFQPSFVNCCLSNLLSGSTSPPPPALFVSNYSIYRQQIHYYMYISAV
jgi:hypothetical protein